MFPNTIEFKKNNISLKIFISDWVYENNQA